MADQSKGTKRTTPGAVVFTVFVVLATLIPFVQSGEFTFELADRDQQCFHEEFKEKGKEVILEFQVIRGGNFDVDLRLFSPSGKIMYDEQRKQYDSISFYVEETGEHYFCFSNEFSSFTHKTVYFDLISDLDDTQSPEVFGGGEEPHSLTLMETSLKSIHAGLKIVEDYQTHHRLREARGRNQAEVLSERVLWWSIGEAIIVVLVGIGQVFILRRFFTDKKSTI